MPSILIIISLALLALQSIASPTGPQQNHIRQDHMELVVTTAPDYVRPYVARAYTFDGLQLGTQVYRFPVTGNSSDGAFTLISTAGPQSDSLGVLPHIHHTHYENFFWMRSSQAVWANDEARILMPGDFGTVPHNTNHTFQLLAPYNELVGVIQPGGFEALFYFLAQANYTLAIDTPFLPVNAAVEGGVSPDIINNLETFDVFAELTYAPRHDFVNDTAPAGQTWRNGDNALAENSTSPFFVASDFGSSYLNNSTGMYQLIEPLLTPTQTDGSMTLGKLSISETLPGAQRPLYNMQNSHTAFEGLDGQLTLQMERQTVELEVGDVAFIPKGTAFSYWSEVAFTNVLCVGSSKETLQQQLLDQAGSWDWAMFPSTAHGA